MLSKRELSDMLHLLEIPVGEGELHELVVFQQLLA